MKRFPGLHLSPPDERDYPLAAVAEPAEKPHFASLKHYIREVLDQGKTPTCAAHAICAAFEAVFGIRFSIRWAYWKAKEIDGIDAPGTTYRAILKVATKQGLCPEEVCPSWPDWEDMNFTPEMAREAAKYKLKAYANLQVGTLEEIEKAIASGLFVLLGTIVTSDNWLDDDEFITEPSGAVLGGHATLGVEYDEHFVLGDMKDFVTLLNSWGEDKGDGGYYKMAERYAQWKSDIGMPALMEAWAVTFDEKLTPKVRGEDMQLRKGEVKFAVIHHPAKLNEYTAAEVLKVHKARGFETYGYNKLIEPDGNVVEGRDPKYRGAHTYVEGAADPQYWNENALGYCLVWNGDEEPFPDVVYKALAKGLKKDGFHPAQVRLHGEVDATACPGKYFDKAKLFKLLEAEWGMKEDLPKIQGKANAVFKGRSINAFIRSPGKTVADVTDVCDLLGLKYDWDNETKTMTIKEV